MSDYQHPYQSEMGLRSLDFEFRGDLFDYLRGRLFYCIKTRYYLAVPVSWEQENSVRWDHYHRPVCVVMGSISAIFDVLTLYCTHLLGINQLCLAMLTVLAWDALSLPTYEVGKWRVYLFILWIFSIVCGEISFSILLLLWQIRSLTYSITVVRMFKAFRPSLLHTRTGDKFGSRWRCVTLNRHAKDNMCAWRVIFRNPVLAQAKLSDRPDGKMSAEVLRLLADSGKVSVYDSRGWLDSSRRSRPCGIKVYVDGGHMRAKEAIPSRVYDLRVKEDYNGPPLGVFIPNIRFKRMRPNATRSDLLGLERELRLLVDKSPKGMMAECGLLALREELDIVSQLCQKPELRTASPTDVAKEYLTNPHWTGYDCDRRMWIKAVGPRQLNIDVDPMDSALTKPQLVWTGEHFAYAVWKLGYLHRVTHDVEGMEPAEHGPYLIRLGDLPYRRGLAYAKQALSLCENTIYECRSTLNEGVPSCGKSTFIRENFLVGDLTVQPNREGTEEALDSGLNARTIDSVVVNGYKDGIVNTLWVDEGLLAHCGAIMMCVQLTRCKECHVFGDSNQLKYIVRTPNYSLVNYNYPWTEPPVYHNKAYMNPEIVCDILRPFYPNGYICMSGRHGEVYVNPIHNIESVQPGHSVYLTYTQGEKATVQYRLSGVKVMTINEAQGLRFVDVALVRLTLYDLTIYKDISQNIVALSRTSNKFTYYTVNKRDTMSTWLLEKSAPKRGSLNREVFKCDPYNYIGGNYTPVINRPVSLRENEPDDMWWPWRVLMFMVGDGVGPNSLTFLTPKSLRRKTKWSYHLDTVPYPTSVQAVLDVMYHRRNDMIASDQRTHWPIKWPDGMKVDLVKSARRPALKPRPALKNVLKTPQPPRALKHPLDEAKAFDGRVVHAPRQKTSYSPELSDELVNTVLTKCFNKHTIETLNATLPLDNKQMKVTWWLTRNSKKRAGIILTDTSKVDGMKYNTMVRGDHKPKLSDDHGDDVPTGQLVTAMNPFWSSLFAPLFQTMLIKVIASLRPNVIFNTRLTWEELDGRIDNLLSGKHFKSLELDIGKFDKSQDETMLDAQCRLFEVFGMETWLVELWRAYHELCKLTSPRWGARYWVGYQRRSGDPLTWLGNTLVLLMTLSYLYDIDKAYMVLVGGDDNVCAFPTNYTVYDKSRIAAEVLNFELKPLSFTNSIYFSSRFIILTHNGWTTIADPVKLIVRLGRNDIQGRAHLKAIHDSWKELHYKYTDPLVRNELCNAAMERYSYTLRKNVTGLRTFINLVAGIYDNYYVLENYFTGSRDEWNLKLDPGERVGGGLYETIVDVYTDDI